jgi:hypothetical protein
MAGMELLHVLPAFCLRAREGDLDHLPHFGRPATERFDELAQRQTTDRLGAKSMLMNVLHGDRILAAVRRALPDAVLARESACDV